MNFKESLRRMFRKTSETKDPVSVVLLQRVPRFLTKEMIAFAAERAWHRSFQSEDEHSRYFVVQEVSAAALEHQDSFPKAVTFVKIGPWMLNVLQTPQPYHPEMDVKALARFLPQQTQRDAWLAHKAWIAIDCHNNDQQDESKYCVMANLASELLDDNVSGVYFPAKGALAPHDDQLHISLKGIANSKQIEIE